MHPAFLPSVSLLLSRPIPFPRKRPSLARPEMCQAPPPLSRRAVVFGAAAALLSLRPTFALPSSTATDEKAAQNISRRNSRVSGTSASLYGRARRDAAIGNLNGALESYNSLIAAEPSFAPAFSNRANILVTQGRLTDSLSDYTRALELAPLEADRWVVLVNRGCVYLGLDDVEKALEDFGAAASEGNGDPVAIYSNRAACWERLGNWDRALKDYQRAIDANAADVQPWWMRYALVLYERDRSAEAVGILKRVSTRFDAPDVHAALAGVLFARGEVEEAEMQWRQVDRPRSFSSEVFLTKERKWTPRLVKAMREFSMTRSSKPAKV